MLLTDVATASSGKILTIYWSSRLLFIPNGEICLTFYQIYLTTRIITDKAVKASRIVLGKHQATNKGIFRSCKLICNHEELIGCKSERAKCKEGKVELVTVKDSSDIML